MRKQDNRCPGAGPQGHEAQGLLLEAVSEDYGLLVLVPGTSQDLGVEVHLQLDLRYFDIFSAMVKYTDHGTQEQGKSSDAKIILTRTWTPVLCPPPHRIPLPHPTKHAALEHHFQHSCYGCFAPTSPACPY